MLSNGLVGLVIILHIVLALLLARKYLLTRGVAYLWLGVAVILWPIITRVLDYGEGILIRRLGSGQLIGFYPFSLVERGQMTIGSLLLSLNLLQQFIGVGLLLVAVLYLCKDQGKLQSTA